MAYYVFIENEKINGSGTCACLNEEITNFEVTEEVYNAYVANPDKFIWDGNDVVINPNYEQQQAQKERERLSMLNLTAADVERAIYKAKGMDFDDVIALVEQYNEAAPLDAEGNSTGVDIKALKIELKANNFYRGSEWVNKIGSLLGFTSSQLDLFFKDGDYTHLLSE